MSLGRGVGIFPSLAQPEQREGLVSWFSSAQQLDCPRCAFDAPVHFRALQLPGNAKPQLHGERDGSSGGRRAGLNENSYFTFTLKSFRSEMAKYDPCFREQPLNKHSRGRN